MTNDSGALIDGQLARITWDHPRVSSGVDVARWHADKQRWELLTMPACIASWVLPEHVTSGREPTRGERRNALRRERLHGPVAVRYSEDGNHR